VLQKEMKKFKKQEKQCEITSLMGFCEEQVTLVGRE
jgi:hypothetical protein